MSGQVEEAGVPSVQRGQTDATKRRLFEREAQSRLRDGGAVDSDDHAPGFGPSGFGSVIRRGAAAVSRKLDACRPDQHLGEAVEPTSADDQQLCAFRGVHERGYGRGRDQTGGELDLGCVLRGVLGGVIENLLPGLAQHRLVDPPVPAGCQRGDG